MSTNPPPNPRYAVAGGADQPEVLVAFEHGSLVQNVLSRAGARPGRAQHSTQLQLTRLQLDGSGVTALVDGLPQVLAEDHDMSAGVARQQIEQLAGTDHAEPVDRVLGHLRAFFRLRYAGWVPTMGKNRLVGHVGGGGGTVSHGGQGSAGDDVSTTGGTVSHGGGPDPEPAAAPDPRAGTAGSGITVGVLDTGLVAHPTFAGRDIVSADLLGPSREHASFAAGHATFVTGLVLQLAPGVSVRAARVLGDDGQATSWDVANAIVALGRQGVDVLNLSFVCHTVDRRPPLALAAAIDRLDPDTLVVACAGNHGGKEGLSETERRQPAWPAALDDVVAVGSARWSTEGRGASYELSSFTPHDAPWIDVVTQGEALRSAYLTGAGPGDSRFDGGARWGGTSFSAALIAGRIAADASTYGIPAREAWLRLMPSLYSSPSERSWLPPFLDLSGDLS